MRVIIIYIPAVKVVCGAAATVVVLFVVVVLVVVVAFSGPVDQYIYI